MNIYLRLFLPFVFSLVLTTSAAWWIATSLLSATLEQRLDRQLEHVAEVLAQGGLPLTEDLLLRLGRLLRLDIVLIDRQGKLGLTTLDERGAKWRAAIERRVDIWRRSGASRFDLNHGGLPFRLNIHALDDARDRRFLGVAALASLADIQQATQHAAWWLGAAVATAILILAWFGHRLAHGITVPIRQLVRMAESVADGDREVRVSISGPQEVAMLGNALNSMAGHLAAYEQDIAQQSRLATLGAMASRVAHEIGNPLTAIKLQVQLLSESLGPRQSKTVGTILNEIKRLELIVSGTLAIGHPRSLHKQPRDLNDLVLEMTDLMEPQMDHRGISLSTHLEPLPLAPLDGDAVKQILLNLLTNAADELAHGGSIEVHTQPASEDNGIVLRVEDSGPGVDAGNRDKVFTPLASTKAGGHGVGLALSRKLVELHGGTIEVDGSAELGGACFTIHLPLSNTDIDCQ